MIPFPLEPRRDPQKSEYNRRSTPTSAADACGRGRLARWGSNGNRRWSMLVLAGIAALAVIGERTKVALTESSVVTVPAVADTYLKQGTPNTNQGGENLL